MRSLDRRKFMTGSLGAASVAMVSRGSVRGANERVVVGIMGLGRQGHLGWPETSPNVRTWRSPISATSTPAGSTVRGKRWKPPNAPAPNWCRTSGRSWTTAVWMPWSTPRRITGMPWAPSWPARRGRTSSWKSPWPIPSGRAGRWWRRRASTAASSRSACSRAARPTSIGPGNTFAPATWETCIWSGCTT